MGSAGAHLRPVKPPHIAIEVWPSTSPLSILHRVYAGGLIALEHDRHWAALVQDHLRRETLDTIARVLHAPLQGEPPWYRLAGLEEVPDEVDLLVVDGPPACDPDHGTRRAPALSRFAERLVVGATVMLDDINRPGERKVIAGWEASTDWRFVLDERAGVAIGRRDTYVQASNANSIVR
jgi:hypothetical protein